MMMITAEQAKMIKELTNHIERLHPAIKRRLCQKILKTFEKILLNAEINSKYDANIFTRTEQLISWMIYEYKKIGYLALLYFIKYHEATLEDLND